MPQGVHTAYLPYSKQLEPGCEVSRAFCNKKCSIYAFCGFPSYVENMRLKRGEEGWEGAIEA